MQYGKTTPAPRMAFIKDKLPLCRRKYKTRIRLNNEAKIVVELKALQIGLKYNYY